MNLKQALVRAQAQLATLKDVENLPLESEVLLRYVLQINRAELFLDMDNDLEAAQEAVYQGWIERRLQGEPLAYIINCREFFGLDFFVDQRVLIPRPESEHLVEEALCFAGSHPVETLADIGTGSGAIAVSLALNLSHSPSLSQKGSPAAQSSSSLNQVRIYATDISAAALEVAAINCRKHGLSERISLLQGDLLNVLPEPVDILIANMPYVTHAEVAHMPSAKYEPVLALDGGECGLDILSRLCHQLQGKVTPGGCALIEIGLGQSRAVSALLRQLYPRASIEIIPDLAGIDRVVKLLF